MSVSAKLALIAKPFSELDNVADYIALAESQVDQRLRNRELAVAFLTAHIIEMANRKGAGGAISSETEGSLSVSYADANAGLGLNSTSYGVEYARLARNSAVGMYQMRTFEL